jgi:hypothetical protein
MEYLPSTMVMILSDHPEVVFGPFFLLFALVVLFTLPSVNCSVSNAREGVD